MCNGSLHLFHTHALLRGADTRGGRFVNLSLAARRELHWLGTVTEQ